MEYGQGDVIAGRYTIVEQLGAGGFGTVFRADDLIEEHPIALKLLGPHDDIAVVRREFLPLQRLDHPNIVEAGQPAQAQDGRWVIPFEHVDGPNLRERLMKDGPLEPDELRDLGTQLLSALSTIHPDEARISELEGRSDEGQLDQATFDLLRELKADALVHRDINPNNVMIRSDGTVVLVDFGISSRAGTQAKTSSGTYDYWPPDLSVVALDRWDPDVDRYAAGATLFEAACGVLPYHGVDRQEDVAELQAFRSDLPVEVGEFFLDACWPDRDGRFRSTAEMAKAWRDAWTDWEPASTAVEPFTPWTVNRHWEYVELDDEDLRGLVVEIVETEGSILCRRLYDLVAEAIGERPTARLNRLVYRMVSQWGGPLSQVEPLGNGQQDKTVYMAGADPHVVRTLGERELWDLPGVERRAHIAQARRSLGLANEADGDPAAIADLVAMSLAPDRTPEEQADLAENVHHWIAPRGR